jgi:hypothetical protein
MLHLAMKAFWPGKPPFPLREIDRCGSRRAIAASCGAPHHGARRRQRPPRPQPRSRLHRRGPGREHPPHCRSREADGGSRLDRDRELHLAVSRRAAHGARWSARTSSSRFMSTPRSRFARRAIPTASTSLRARGSSRTSPASAAPTSRPSRPSLYSPPGRSSRKCLRRRCSRRCGGGGSCEIASGAKRIHGVRERTPVRSAIDLLRGYVQTLVADRNCECLYRPNIIW